MNEKPSLYVVERKEVIILVVLFVLVTVLSFTMGVRYGESVGKKSAKLEASAEQEYHQTEAESQGGSLGVAVKEQAAKEEHAEAKTPEASAAEGSHAPKTEEAKHAETEGAPKELKDAVDKNSDEFLLNALKEAGVEAPGAKAPGNAKLPEEPKRVKAGSYVIQVGSHPTRSEAENQVRLLKAKRLDAEILAPFKDRQGEWHRVVLGSYKTKREAEREAKNLKAKGAIVSFFVWRLP